MRISSFVPILWCAALFFFSGCASQPTPKPSAADRRLRFFDSQLSQQEAEIRRLTQTISSLEKALKSKPEAKKTSSLPLTRLTPDAPHEEDILLEDEYADGESDSKTFDPIPMSEANVIADSGGAALNHYYRGLEYFEEKRFENAQREFHAFLQSDPKHVYADRAQFMELECHFENHDYGLAIFASNQLEGRYPYSLRLPEALHKRALAYLEMGQPSKSVVTLRDLMRRFPASPVTDGASRLLASLSHPKDGSEGKQVWEGHL